MMNVYGSLLIVAVGCSSGGDSSGSSGTWPDILPEYADYVGSGGGAIGDSIQSFQLVDQNGDVFDYRSVLGAPHVIDIAGVWCIACQVAAETSTELFDAMQRDAGAWLITVLVEDQNGGVPTAPDANEWASSFDLAYPVLADEFQVNFRDWTPTGWPTYLFVDADGTIVDRSDEGLPDEEILARLGSIEGAL